MFDKLSTLGGLSAEQFFSDYWQKKPLLVRNAIPEIINILEPDDILELALEESINARLITQHNHDKNQWNVKNSPLQETDFHALPQYWTLLVQAVDHHSFEIAELWKNFNFIPQWRRDDIMVSFAPKGGSVGQHFDFYDVFLVQAYGHRRWQLGQYCDEDTKLLPHQPLKLLEQMDVSFDEVLSPGDLLYVPPNLSHYGVAEDECLTFSFGFRMPNIATMLDRVSDKFADTQLFKNPVNDHSRTHVTSPGEVKNEELHYLKSTVIDQLLRSPNFDHALVSLLSEAKYTEHFPISEEMKMEELMDVVAQSSYELSLEPASRLLYINQESTLIFWANGEKLTHISEEFKFKLKHLADGNSLIIDHTLNQPTLLNDILSLLNESILVLSPIQSNNMQYKQANLE